MAQWTDVDLVTATDDGVDVANQINNLRAAFNSTSLGATPPTAASRGMIWTKDLGTDIEVWCYDGTDHVRLGTVDVSDGTFVVGLPSIEAALLGQAVPPAAVMYFARNTAPTGWLKANGAAVSRTTYSNLFGAIGSTYGGGDGSTTFNLPDLRGEFIRGWDDGRGVDSGRAFGSAQTDNLPTHKHNTPIGFDGSTLTGYLDGASEPIYGVDFATGNRISIPGTFGTSSIRISRTAAAILEKTTEVRPRNLAQLACIKF